MFIISWFISIYFNKKLTINYYYIQYNIIIQGYYFLESEIVKEKNWYRETIKIYK